MIKAVIIDFDDTLSLTEEGCFGLENETLRRMGRPLMSREIHKQTWGQPLGDAIQVRSPGIDLDEFWRVMPEVHEEFIANGQVDVVTEESIAALDELVASGKQLMILTSRTEPEIKHLISPENHLAGRLTDFYHKDNMEYHKPDPRAFDVIERDHGLAPSDCIYVGDSPSDAASAKGAGLHFIASLESGLRTKEDFDGYPVDRFIDKFTELTAAIDSIEAT